MKPPFTAAEFMRRAREAQYDSLGIDGDVEATIALANVARGEFLHLTDATALVRWESLVDEVGGALRGSADDMEERVAILRWIAVESVRLATARRSLGEIDENTRTRLQEWASDLDQSEQAEISRGLQLEQQRVRVARAPSEW